MNQSQKLPGDGHLKQVRYEEQQPVDFAQMQRQAMKRLQFWINRSAGQHARQIRESAARAQQKPQESTP